jgi:probable rRNA maturation factor
MRITWVNQTQKPIPKAFLSRCLISIIKQLKSKKRWSSAATELVLVFVSPNEIRKLNSKFRNKNKPTDVLSFAAIEEGSLGELVFCPQILNSQAIEVGHSYSWELAYMLLHGVLHLLGYEHESSDKDAREMYRLQDRLMQHLRKTLNVRRNRTRRSQKKLTRNRK